MSRGTLNRGKVHGALGTKGKLNIGRAQDVRMVSKPWAKAWAFL